MIDKKENDVIKRENDRLIFLENKYPELSKIKKIFLEKMKTGDDFIISTNNKWHQRQYIHILAHLNGLFSKTIMTECKLSSFSNNFVRCSRCRHVLKMEYSFDDSFCCMWHDGRCNNCNGFESYPECIYKGDYYWDGDIKISRNKMKLGRRKRRQINRWRYGENLTKMRIY